MGFSWAMFSRALFLVLLLTFCSSGAEVVTVDVHATKDPINSGHKYLDVSLGAEVVTVDVHASKDLINSGHKYLDVRTVEEFKKGHVGADKILNIPYLFNTPEGRVKNPQFLSEVSSVCNKEDQIIVGCQSGVRSLSATADLLSAGFKHVSNMGGGYLAWVENGFLVQKPNAEL
ncbi:thiosulfate sulfurtransferase 18 isoform X1 [Quercus lobata]|uniref:Rhodanese domain-containing protein n=1 Tax=Quercus lobata TaxID=97700 RepID=A0A7N2M1S3_QUELO|nr:thiosulfate sulfurtransferase 18 isoform X1 [Quercus lobata]